VYWNPATEQHSVCDGQIEAEPDFQPSALVEVVGYQLRALAVQPAPVLGGMRKSGKDKDTTLDDATIGTFLAPFV
jgi:hypothetical protein